MNRLKLVILLGFAIMFVAGLAIGRSHSTPPAPKPDDHPLHNLRDEVGLTADQEKQIEQVWHDARVHADTMARQFHDFDRQRDEAIAALMSPEQNARYQEIRHEHDERVAAVRKDIGKSMQEASQKTRSLLTPEQAKKFDSFIQKHHRHGPPTMGMEIGPERGTGIGREHHRRRGNPDTQPATAPASAPTTLPES